jgi:hypothetical protein
VKLTAEQIEQAIDADGAWNLLLTIEIVLGEKSALLREGMSTAGIARTYDRFSKKCGTLARELEQANI